MYIFFYYCNSAYESVLKVLLTFTVLLLQGRYSCRAGTKLTDIRRSADVVILGEQKVKLK
jgi:hypothetical protein